MTIYAFWKSFKNKALTCGLSFTLTYKDLHRSISGFMNNLDIDFKKAFSCPRHGNSPKCVVSDGKSLGPLKRRVDHLQELCKEESDDRVLQQSTQSKKRVFLTSKKERAAVCQILTGDISMQDFCEVSEITSDNGRLIMDMVRHILQTFPDEMPSSYKHFIANVCKPTSVRGLLQVLTSEPLEFLEQFCKRQLIFGVTCPKDN